MHFSFPFLCFGFFSSQAALLNKANANMQKKFSERKFVVLSTYR